MTLASFDRATFRRFAVADVTAILLLIAVGVLRHGGHPIYEPVGYVDAVAPFLVGWAIAAPLFGAYAASAGSGLRAGVTRAAFAWVGAAVVGQILRATPVFGGGAALSFFLVVSVLGVLVLAVARGVVTALAG